MAMDANTFETVAEEYLEDLMDQADEAIGDEVDVELNGGILTITLPDGGQYVVNKHSPNKQIWLSSPVSGAHHFEFDDEEEQWISTRGDAVLEELLSEELSAATGEDVLFEL